MRLLYVIDSLAPGGAETSLAAMASGLIKSGIDLHVLPLGTRRDLSRQLEEAGAKVHARTRRAGRIGSIQTVLDVARDIRPALIHTTLYESDVMGRIAARLLDVPSSTSIVNDSYGSAHYRESNRAKLHAAQALDAATGKFATRFHFITAAIAETVAPRLGIPHNRVEVIPRGRAPENYPLRSDDVRWHLREKFQIPEGAPVVLSVARHEPQKGLNHLLEATSKLVPNHPTVVVLLAGKEGRSSAALRAQAASIDADIRFLGHRTDVADLLAASDVFCFPSEREGFGGVLIEAMAVGCPIVASSIPTSLEVLGPVDDDCAILVPAADPLGFARGIERLLTDISLAERLAHNGRRRFDAQYSITSVTQRMANFFIISATLTPGPILRQSGAHHPTKDRWQWHQPSLPYVTADGDRDGRRSSRRLESKGK